MKLPVRIAAMFVWSFCFACLPAVLCAQVVVRHPPGTYVDAGGVKLWVESEGQGEPLVLVPGGPGDSHSVYHPFFSQLANHYRVIYFDAFGVGQVGACEIFDGVHIRTRRGPSIWKVCASRSDWRG